MRVNIINGKAIHGLNKMSVVKTAAGDSVGSSSQLLSHATTEPDVARKRA